MKVLSAEVKQSLESRFGAFNDIEEIKGAVKSKDELIPLVSLILKEHGGELNAHKLRELQWLLKELCHVNFLKVTPSRSRITEGAFQYLTQLENMEALFKAKIYSQEPISLGVIVFSATRFGGLLSSHRINFFLQALIEDIHNYEGIYWYELESNKDPYPVRWFPDNLTLTLISLYKKQTNTNQFMGNIKWHSCLKKEGFTKLSHNEYLDACSIALSLKVPSALVDTARSVSDTRSLDRIVFLRLLNGKKPTLNMSAIVEEAPLVPFKGTVYRKTFKGSGYNRKAEKELFKDTGHLLRKSKETRKVIKQQMLVVIERYQKQCVPIAVLLCEWSAFRLTELNHWGSKFTPSTAYTRRSHLRSFLSELCGGKNILNFTNIEMSELYFEVVEHTVSPDERIRVTKSLRDFHYFLEKKYGKDELDDAPWHSLSNNYKSVDAKVIWPKEYQNAIDHLAKIIDIEDDDKKQWRWKMCRLALILGYRCGLRRSEIRFLRHDDIVGKRNIELLIRPNDDFALKSINATRRLPLHALLTKGELSTVTECLKKGNAKYILHDFYDQESSVSAKYIFDPIQQLLKHVTGDREARFHHLRHSLATISFYRWQIPTGSTFISELLYEEGIDIEHQRITVLGTGPKQQQRLLHALSALLGHAGPQMTLAHYIHCSDLLLFEYCNQALPHMTQNDLGSLMNVLPRQIREVKTERATGIEQINKMVNKNLVKHCNKPNLNDWSNFNSDATVIMQGSFIENSRAIRIWQALSYYSNSTSSLNEASERFSISVTALEKAVSNSCAFMQLKFTQGNYKTYRHHFREWKKLDKPPLFFQMPKNNRDYDWVVKMLKNYEQLDTEEKNIIHSGVKYFIYNSGARYSEIAFTVRDDFNNFLKIFPLLKLNHRIKDQEYPAYRLSLRHNNEIDSLERHKAWDYWMKSKDIPDIFKETIFKNSPFIKNIESSSSIGKFGDLSLQVLAVKAERPVKKYKRTARQAAWGFRLGLYVLASIYLDF